MYSPGGKGTQSILEESLALNQSVLKIRQHLIWGFANGVIVALLIFNLFPKSIDNSMKGLILYNSQILLAVILSINSLFHLAKYCVMSLNLRMKPICLSPAQKKLLGIDQSDKYFKSADKSPASADIATRKVEAEFTATSPMNLSATTWLSSLSPPSKGLSTSPSATPTSWQQRSSPSHPVTYSSPGAPRSPGEDIIRDELELTRYFDSVEAMERRAVVGDSVEQPQELMSSFWNSPNANSTAEVSPLLRRCVYQMAAVSTAQPSCSPNNATDEGNSPSAATSNLELWRRVKIDPNHLTQWNANLRMWISLTILQRVVKELDFIDDAFLRCSLSDLRLGSVGWDRLKKTASIPQVVASVPSLPRLVPFLELSPHQEYLVSRIRALAKGGSLSEFRWNSGGSVNGKTWEEHLPTDAALVMHLIATYLDLQMLPLPHRPDARPFSAQYLVRSPEKPPRNSPLPVIYQAQLNPPHFVVVDKDQVIEVPKGRNNVFYAFLMFLHTLKTREHGMLGPVNLGLSGVNVLWVIDS